MIFLESFGFPNGDLHNLGFIIQNFFNNFVAETFDMVFTERGFDVIRSDVDTYRNMVLRKNDIDKHIRFRCFSNLFTYAKSDKTLFRFFKPSDSDVYNNDPEFIVRFFKSEFERWLDSDDDIVITNTPELCFPGERTKSLASEFKNIYPIKNTLYYHFFRKKKLNIILICVPHSTKRWMRL